MCLNNELTELVTEYTVNFTIEPKWSPQEAIMWLVNEREELCKRSSRYFCKVILNSRISLKMPGKYDSVHPGDYCLLWNGKPPKHRDVCDALIEMIDSEEKYNRWVFILEDVYYNGTKNLDNYTDEKEHFAVQLLFWVTLQEDINKYDKLGRLTPFCRYAEAIATTQNTVSFTLEDVSKRIEYTDPRFLEHLVLPTEPKFYKWSAF